MPTGTSKQSGKYARQRPKVSSPVVTTAVLRKALKLTLQDVCDHINREFDFGKKVERGTISAFENGMRGASVQMLTAYASALGIPVSAIDTQYEPRNRSQEPAA